MSSSGLLAYHVANDAVVSAVSWYTFLCANDVRSSDLYRWRINLNGCFQSLKITLRATPVYKGVVLGDCWLSDIFFMA